MFHKKNKKKHLLELKNLEELSAKVDEIFADLNELNRRLDQVIEEREVAYGDDPIGASGLYIRKFKILGREYPEIVEEYSLDNATIRMKLRLLKQAAKLEKFKDEIDADKAKARENESAKIITVRFVKPFSPSC